MGKKSAKMKAVGDISTLRIRSKTSKKYEPRSEPTRKARHPRAAHCPDGAMAATQPSNAKLLKSTGRPRSPAPQAAVTLPAEPKRLQKIKRRGRTFKIGDHVYVVTNVDEFNAKGGFDEMLEIETCEICHKCEAGQATLLECSRCARGFHTVCLTPKIYDEPEGDYECADCQAGSLKLARDLVTLRQRYLAGDHGIDVGRIVSITQAGHKECELRICWYSVPQSTCFASKTERIAREIFATDAENNIPVKALLRPCLVLQPRDFAETTTGDDIFLCQYHNSKKGFKRIREDENGDSNSKGEDDAFTMQDNARHSRDMWGKLSGRSRARRKVQGGLDWELATAQIPSISKGDPFEQAKEALATTTQPKSLPCRDKERAKIDNFVRNALHADEGGPGCCMFIGGKPGTGKTATVNDVMRCIKDEQRAHGSMRPFQFLTINGLRLSTPKQAYSSLYEAITGVRLGAAAAGEALTEIFQGGKNRAGITVLLVDELDRMLQGTKQEVVYNLMEWPLQKDSRLIVIGIGNTIDLPERLLPRINSRLGDNKIAFPPYSKHDMRQIMTHRLRLAEDPRSHNLLSKEALDMATIKASHTADLRKSLQLGIRAIEIAQSELATPADATARRQTRIPDLDSYDGLVSIDHVLAASREMFGGNDVVMRMCDNLSTLCQLFLAAMLIQTNISGSMQTRLLDVNNRVRDMAAAHEMDPSRFEMSHCVMAAAQLRGQGFIHAVGEGPAMHLSLVDNFPDSVLRTSLCRIGAVPWLSSLNLG